MTQQFEKVVRLGTAKTCGGRHYSIYAKIKFDGKKLSISGVEGPLPSGNCLGGAGQIDMHKPIVETLAPGWSRSTLKRFWDTWARWHLNDMQAACEHQRAKGETYKTHPDAICPDCNYSLGSKWLTEAVPDDVLQFLVALPETDKTPAWV